MSPVGKTRKRDVGLVNRKIKRHFQLKYLLLSGIINGYFCFRNVVLLTANSKQNRMQMTKHTVWKSQLLLFIIIVSDETRSDLKIKHRQLQCCVYCINDFLRQFVYASKSVSSIISRVYSTRALNRLMCATLCMHTICDVRFLKRFPFRRIRVRWYAHRLQRKQSDFKNYFLNRYQLV